MGIRESIETRIAELKKERVQLQESLEIIRDRITKADEKYHTEKWTIKHFKWNPILTGLEEKLDRTRALLVSCEAELKEKTRKLAEHGGVPGQAPEEESQTSPTAAADRIPTFKRLVAETDGECAGPFSAVAVPVEAPEDINRQEPRAATLVTVDAAVMIGAESGLPAAKGSGPAKGNPEETLPDDLLTIAMDKVARGLLAEVTFGELDHMLARYVAVLHRPSPTPKEQELEQSLAECIHKVDRELARLHRKWIPYAPIEPQ